MGLERCWYFLQMSITCSQMIKVAELVQILFLEQSSKHCFSLSSLTFQVKIPLDMRVSCVSEVNTAFLACFFISTIFPPFLWGEVAAVCWLPTLTPSCCTVWFMHFWFTHTAHIIFVQQGVCESSGSFISSRGDLLQLFRLKQTPNRTTLRSQGKICSWELSACIHLQRAAEVCPGEGTHPHVPSRMSLSPQPHTAGWDGSPVAVWHHSPDYPGFGGRATTIRSRFGTRGTLLPAWASCQGPPCFVSGCQVIKFTGADRKEAWMYYRAPWDGLLFNAFSINSKAPARGQESKFSQCIFQLKEAKNRHKSPILIKL